MLGHDVTIFEERNEAGGMLRFAIPEYRLPKSVLRRELDLIEGVGVKMVFNTRVGFDLPLNDMAAASMPSSSPSAHGKSPGSICPALNSKNVYPALPFLEAVARNEKVKLGSRVAIIGGGNAAIDSARTVLRMGAQATILYRRERKDMPAIDEEIQAAEEEGVRFVFLAAPHRILGDAEGNVKAIEIVKTRLGEYDKSGRRRPIPTDRSSAWNATPSSSPSVKPLTWTSAAPPASSSRKKARSSWIASPLRPAAPDFYAGGDVITGASNVSNAMGGGKQAARNIDERLMGQNRPWEQLFPGLRIQPPGPRRAQPQPPPCRARRCLPRRAPAPRRKSLPASVPRKPLKSAAAAFVAICRARSAQ